MRPYRFYILFLLLGIAALYVYSRSEVAVPVNQSFALFPQTAEGWKMVGQSRFDERTLEVLKPTDYLSREYSSDDGESVGLYVGYHDGGPKSGPIHSPRQCLPGSGWNRIKDEVRALDIGDRKVSYVSAVYEKDTAKQLFLYWFQVKGDILTDEYALKLMQLKNSVMSNQRDSAFIRLALSVTENEEQSILTGEQFIRSFFPAISHALPQ